VNNGYKNTGYVIFSDSEHLHNEKVNHHAGGNGGGKLLNTGANSGTCPACVHAAIPDLHTFDSRLNVPCVAICVNCSIVKGPVCAPLTATKN
jgi:hypothetical protein